MYPKAYVDFLVLFHGERDYFECHEMMEELWKQERGSKLSSAWLGLIQVSVSLYHQRRGNIAGARKMLDSAIVNLQLCDLREVGIDGEIFLKLLKSHGTFLNNADETAPYTDLNIPVWDPSLIGLCMEECRKRGLQWESSSPMDNDRLVHKHLLRDRSEVVDKRQAALAEKQRKKKT